MTENKMYRLAEVRGSFYNAAYDYTKEIKEYININNYKISYKTDKINNKNVVVATIKDNNDNIYTAFHSDKIIALFLAFYKLKNWNLPKVERIFEIKDIEINTVFTFEHSLNKMVFVGKNENNWYAYKEKNGKNIYYTYGDTKIYAEDKNYLD